MEIKAIVATGGSELECQDLELAAPGHAEVLVRIVATGVCHTDISVLDGIFPPGPPVVLGHEGAGIVEAVGVDVTHVAPGDHVVLTFDSCGACRNCLSDHPGYCEMLYQHNQIGCRVDGTNTLTRQGEPIGGSFFGQSSFATYSIASGRNTVKVRKDAPLELLGPLGCGFQTGAGAVLNVLKPEPGTTIAIVGCGGVGLSALMAAKIAGCGKIIAIDRVISRLERAEELGATHVIDTSKQDIAKEVKQLGGLHYAVEATGVPALLELTSTLLLPRGSICVLGGPPQGVTAKFEVSSTLMMHNIVSAVEGDSNPHVFIPDLVDRFMLGEFPLDQLVSLYDHTDYARAFADARSGVAVKPVLVFMVSRLNARTFNEETMG